MGIREISLAALAGAALLAPAVAARAEPIRVATVAVGPGVGAAVAELDATIRPVRQATLAAQVGGSVLALHVKPGDRVRAGQPVARIDSRETEAGVRRADAAVAQVRAAREQARSDAARSGELRRQGFLSAAALDGVEARLEAAEAALREVQAAREQAALARGFATVAAPFDALVLATHLEAGDLAAPGRAIATVYAPGELRAVVQVPASRAAALRAASRIEVVLADGRSIGPAARSVLPSADAVSQTVEWRLDLPAGTSGVFPGQAARVRYTGDTAVGFALPSAAILRRGELTAVYVAQRDRFVLRQVRPGATNGGFTEVRAGLKAGERVALDAVRAGLDGAVPAAD